jgi:hypothetical protein
MKLWNGGRNAVDFAFFCSGCNISVRKRQHGSLTKMLESKGIGSPVLIATSQLEMRRMMGGKAAAVEENITRLGPPFRCIDRGCQ